MTPHLYVADYLNRRVVVLEFDLLGETPVWLYASTDSSWRPVDVVWDNNFTIADNSDDYLWIVQRRAEGLVERCHIDFNTQTQEPQRSRTAAGVPR